jgi:hypothetical protein
MVDHDDVTPTRARLRKPLRHVLFQDIEQPLVTRRQRAEHIRDSDVQTFVGRAELVRDFRNEVGDCATRTKKKGHNQELPFPKIGLPAKEGLEGVGRLASQLLDWNPRSVLQGHWPDGMIKALRERSGHRAQLKDRLGAA